MIIIIYIPNEELNSKLAARKFYDDISEILSVNWLWWEFDAMQEIERVGASIVFLRSIKWFFFVFAGGVVAGAYEILNDDD